MDHLTRPPPVVGLALAVAAGATISVLRLPLPWATLLLLPLFLPIPSFKNPGHGQFGIAMGLLAGWLLALAGEHQTRGDCRWALEDGERYAMEGWLTGTPVQGRGDFRPDPSTSPPCSKPLTALLPQPETSGPPPGARIRLSGTWIVSRSQLKAFPKGAGLFRVDSVAAAALPGLLPRRRLLQSAGLWVQSRIRELFPSASGFVAALVWARRDGLARDLREAFARAGVAHLLAISGFHVGVVAGVLLALLALAGVPPRARHLSSALVVWCYVMAIGAPDAAVRAGILLAVLSVGRGMKRPVSRAGALATAFLAFLTVSPSAFFRPGFQLSFAGAFGLALGYRPAVRFLERALGPRAPRVLCQGLAAGCVATLATLPLVAWHFGRVSLVGIPMTLLLTPVIALAIPGIFFSLLLSSLSVPLGRMAAGGVELLLGVAVGLVRWIAEAPWAGIWVSEGAVLWGSTLAILVSGLAFLGIGGIRYRHAGLALAAGFIVGAPLGRALDMGTMEIVMLDVGQGDALLLRSPGGQWVLVDAGPRTMGYDSGERVVLPYLRRRGVGRLALVVLTHPDMDHVGGASAVLDAIETGAVADPGHPTGTEAYLGALRSAQGAEVPWFTFQAGDSLDIDGMALRVLAPTMDGGELSDANDASLVMEVRYGEFGALLMGDAPRESEGRLLHRVLSDRVQVLKVGHHGSTTSTGADLLERVRPETALISVGRRNRFGHPTAVVLDRLRGVGSEVFRTDHSGSVEIRVRRNGTYDLRVAHGQSSPGGSSSQKHRQERR